MKIKWILILLMVFAGCGPSLPEDPPKYQEGDVVYHKIDGRKMVITGGTCFQEWPCRYSGFTKNTSLSEN